MSESDFLAEIEAFRRDYARVVEQVAAVLVGQQDVIDGVLTTLLAGGHALLEGVPGLGKTLLVRTLAEALELDFQRIQFTPDLMPADITGTEMLATDAAGAARQLEFRAGPIFANLVLADEINRATPKTQSAVLEAMAEGTVSVARQSRPLPEPFAVLATQNPIELEGTYPLPEAQLDRFLLKIRIDAPNQDELVAILSRTTGQAAPRAGAVLDAAGVLRLRQTVRKVVAAEAAMHYAAALVRATHPQSESAGERVRQYVRYGASPRAAQAMLLAAKVAACRAGRANVATADIAAAAEGAMAHRLVLNFQALADGVTAEALVAEALAQTPDRP